MRFFYTFFENYGIALILFTLVSKIIMFPASYSQQKGSAKMQYLSPKVAAIKKKFPNNQQRIATETQNLYKDEGYNQFSGCLPALVMLPMLYGVLDVIYRPLTRILRISSGTLNQAKDLINKAIESGNFKTQLDALKINASFMRNRSELAIINISKTAK
jgi:YidC/Oxa1 family membrane protein insertase